MQRTGPWIAVSIVFAGLSCASRQTPARASDPPSLIGALTQSPEDNPDFSDCGCRLRTAQGSLVFIDTGATWLNILGADVMVESDNGFGIGPLQVAETRQDTYESNGVHITIDWTITSVCQQADEGCEFTGADAVITATRGDQTQVVTTSGGCGC